MYTKSTTLTELLSIMQARWYNDARAHADTVRRQAILDALNWLGANCDLDFLWEPDGRINTVATSSTGTVAVTTSTAKVELSTGDFPSWGANGFLQIGGFVREHKVLSITAAVVSPPALAYATLVTAHTWYEATQTAAAYTIYQADYDFPSDMLRLPAIQGDEAFGGLEMLSKEDYQTYRKKNLAAIGGQPVVCSAFDGQLHVWPVYTASRSFDFGYFRTSPLPSADGSNMDWPDEFMHLLIAAADWQMAVLLNKRIPEKWQVLQDTIDHSVPRSKTRQGMVYMKPANLGAASADIETRDRHVYVDLD